MCARPPVCVCASVCASTCGNINRLYYSCVSRLFGPCLRRFVPTLCASSQSSVSINVLFLGVGEVGGGGGVANTPISTCACSFPSGEFTSASQRECICDEEVDGEAREQKQQRRERNRTGRGRRGGGRLITVAGLVAWRRRGPGMPGC